MAQTSKEGHMPSSGTIKSPQVETANVGKLHHRQLHFGSLQFYINGRYSDISHIKPRFLFQLIKPLHIFTSHYQHYSL